MAATKKTTTKEIETMNKNLEIKVGNDLSVKINVCPDLQDRVAFVQAVTDDALINDRIYQPIIDARFDVYFMVLFTDFAFPDEVKNDEGQVDVIEGYNYINRLFRFGFRAKMKEIDDVEALIEQLENDVRQIIDFECKKLIALHSRNIALEETLENISLLVTKGVDLINSASERLNTFTPDAMGEIVKQIPERFLSAVGEK